MGTPHFYGDLSGYIMSFAKGGAVAGPSRPLSESQQKIYDLIAKGEVKSIAEIARRTGTDAGVVHAQITRILSRGQWHENMRTIKDIRLGSKANLPGGNFDSASVPSPSVKPNTPVADGPVVWDNVNTQAPSHGGRSNDTIADEISAGGPAMSYEDLAKQLASKMPPGSLKKDVEPMILLGVAIQFMKLTGGRIAAHQLIEDVYHALQVVVRG